MSRAPARHGPLPPPRPVTLRASGGVELEGRWDGREGPAGAVVLCHPHPLHGGNLQAPLLRGVTRVLAERRLAVLRFNFRGVGSSTGRWSEGAGEVHDVAAAMEAARSTYPELPVGVAGWSFGAATALRWQADAGDTSAYAGIAPPLGPARPAPGDLLPARRTFIIGDRDQFTTVAELEAYAASVGATVEVVAGSDHFFHFRQDRLGELVAEAILTEMPA